MSHDLVTIMEFNYSEYGSRRPRHQAATTPGLRVQVQRSASDDPGWFDAELNNLSRDGFQLLATSSLPVGDSIVVRICVQAAGIDLAIKAEVRWRQSEGPGLWAIGCRSLDQVQWETLGELFLSGVLSMNPAAAEHSTLRQALRSTPADHDAKS
jgi:hypothetical protein